MHGLELTYRILAETRNEAAIEALAEVLPTAMPRQRPLILASLTNREEDRAADLLLENWHHMTPDDLAVLAGKIRWMEDAVARAIESRENIENALSAVSSLGLTESFAAIVSLAESEADSNIRIAATKTVVKLADAQGKLARQERAAATVRGPMVNRLLDCVRHHDQHQNAHLVDAYLLASAWGDVSLRSWVKAKSPIQKLLISRFANTKHRGMIELLAGYLNRRNLPELVAKTIASREDDATRFALLAAIGPTPSGTSLQHISDMGIPACLRNPSKQLAAIDDKHRAALVHCYAAGSKDPIEVLQVITEAILRGGPKLIPAAALSLSRCEIPDADFFMRAAIPVARDMEKTMGDDTEKLSPDALLVKRLIDLLSHRDATLVKSARRVLAPLHAETMLSRFDQLRPRSRRRLGRIVMMIDENALDRVRDALRHPVLEKRLEAIATADAMASVEMLAESFTRIVREDHQAARVRAAEAMASARDSVTLGLLEEMLKLPESQVRDAAADAIEFRKSAVPTHTKGTR